MSSYNIAYTALVGLWVTPLAVLWFISLCLARRQNDPARVGIAWIKTVFPFWLLSSILLTANGGVLIYVYFYYDGYISSERYISFSKLQEASGHLSDVGTWFGNIAEILLTITLVELGGGFSLCLNGGTPTSGRKVNRSVTLAWSFILFAVITAYFGLATSYIIRRYNSEDLTSADLRKLTKDGRTLNRLSLAVTILLWITTLPVLGYVSHVIHKTKNHPMLSRSATLLLTAAILNFIRHTVDLGLSIWWYTYVPSSRTSYENAETITITSYIIHPLFIFVPMFVLLVLLFVLAIRKHDGLWSTATGYGGAQYYNGNATGMAPVYTTAGPVYPQQQQFQQQQQYQQAAPPGVGNAQGPPMPAYLVVAQQKERETQMQG